MKSDRFVIHFPKELVNQPIIYRLTKEFDMSFNIIMARVMPNEEGLMVAELGGDEENFNAGINYLKEKGVDIQPISNDVYRDEKRCTQCGACVAICPTDALYIPDRETMEVVFDVEKCVACTLCVPVCPPRAMNVTLNSILNTEIRKIV